MKCHLKLIIVNASFCKAKRLIFKVRFEFHFAGLSRYNDMVKTSHPQYDSSSKKSAFCHHYWQEVGRKAFLSCMMIVLNSLTSFLVRTIF